MLFWSIERFFIHKLITLMNDDIEDFTNIVDHNLVSVLVVKIADGVANTEVVTILNINVGDNIKMIDDSHLYPCTSTARTPMKT